MAHEDSRRRIIRRPDGRFAGIWVPIAIAAILLLVVVFWLGRPREAHGIVKKLVSESLDGEQVAVGVPRASNDAEAAASCLGVPDRQPLYIKSRVILRFVVSTGRSDIEKRLH